MNTFDAFEKLQGADVAETILTRICEAGWSKTKDEDGLHISDIYNHNAINQVISGTIVHDNVSYGFVVENGNNNGTVVREWGPEDAIGVYEPEPPTVYTLIPSNNLVRKSLGGFNMFDQVYLAWRKESWFEKLVHDYNYDRYFAPGGKTETHYHEAAAKRGLVYAHPDQLEVLMVEYREVKALTQQERELYYDRLNKFTAQLVQVMQQ